MKYFIQGNFATIEAQTTLFLSTADLTCFIEMLTRHPPNLHFLSRLRRKGESHLFREPCSSYNSMYSGAHVDIEIRLYVRGATFYLEMASASCLPSGSGF